MANQFLLSTFRGSNLIVSKFNEQVNITPAYCSLIIFNITSYITNNGHKLSKFRTLMFHPLASLFPAAFKTAPLHSQHLPKMRLSIYDLTYDITHNKDWHACDWRHAYERA